MKPKAFDSSSAVNLAGKEVRETLNQGFIHAELGSSADECSRKVYHNSVSLSPTLLSKHCSSAIDNYMSAISCFLRAIPAVNDTRSQQLLKQEVDKLLQRLECMKQLQTEADRLKGNEDENGFVSSRLVNKNLLNQLSTEHQTKEDSSNECSDLVLDDSYSQVEAENGSHSDAEYEEEDDLDNVPFSVDSAFKFGELVEAFDLRDNSWKDANIVNYDDNTNTYSICYEDDLEEESGLTPDRIRDKTEPNQQVSEGYEAKNEAQKTVYQALCEIVESERLYSRRLQTLKEHYLLPFSKPAHWAGQVETDESLFTMRAINETEMVKCFGNLNDIIELHSRLFNEVEKEFAKYSSESKLACLFEAYQDKFSGYVPYITQYPHHNKAFNSIRRTRMGVKGVEEAAATYGIEPLSELLKMPLSRLQEYIFLFSELHARTPKEDGSLKTVGNVISMFENVLQAVALELNAEKLRAKLKEVVYKFNPPCIELITKDRVLLFDSKVELMVGNQSKKYHVWLFNDVILWGKRNFLSNNLYIKKGFFCLYQYGFAVEFGPYSIYLTNNTFTVKIFIIPKTKEEKDDWLNALKKCTNVKNDTCSLIAEKENNEKLKKSNNAMKRTESGQVDKPLQKSPMIQQNDINEVDVEDDTEQKYVLPQGWVPLWDEDTHQPYYYNEKTQVTQWDRPI